MMCEFLLYNHHIIYSKIKASLGIGGIRIYSVSSGHFAVKKISFRWIPYNLTIAQEKIRVDWCKERHEKCGNNASKHVYNITTGNVSWIYENEPENTTADYLGLSS